MSKRRMAFGLGIMLFTFLAVMLSVSVIPTGWVVKAVVVFTMLYMGLIGYFIGLGDKKN